MRDPLTVPRFARLDEYAAAWCYHPDRFLAEWEFYRGQDLAAHMAAAPAPIRSGLNLLPAAGGKSVALVSVVGTLMKQQTSMGGTSTVQIRRDIRQAVADPNVSGILLEIDSPGGTVAGTESLAAEVKTARRKKPVWAQITDLGASAAYWVASQADQVFASNATTLVGSIGTLQVVYDRSGEAEQAGVKTLVFRTGPMKGAGAAGAPVTSEQAAEFQRLVDAIQISFDAAVRSGRGMSAAQLAAVRTGGVWPAGEALALKLIDGVQSSDKTLAALAGAK